MPRSLPAVITADRASMLEKAAYTRLEQQARRRVAVVAEGLAAGNVTRQGAYNVVAAEIKASTTHAFRLGKAVGVGHRAVLVPMTPAEQRRATAQADYQCARLRAWLLAPQPLVGPPHLLVGPRQMGVGPRLDMYALALHGAYQTGLAFGLLQAASRAKGVALLEDDPLWRWVRSRDVTAIRSCADCIAREARSRVTPYTLTELLTLGFPASGMGTGTACRSRCRCQCVLVATHGDAILTARAHRRVKPTSYHGTVDPATLLVLPAGRVGPGK